MQVNLLRLPFGQVVGVVTVDGSEGCEYFVCGSVVRSAPLVGYHRVHAFDVFRQCDDRPFGFALGKDSARREVILPVVVGLPASGANP